MARVSFTQNIQRHVECPVSEAPGTTVREVLDAVFQENPRARHYVFDERGDERKHMVVFINCRPVGDRKGVSDAVSESSVFCLMQALSFG